MAKISDLRELSVEELTARLGDLKKESLNLRVQASTGQLDNTARILQVRREIAQVNTLFTELKNQADN